MKVLLLSPYAEKLTPALEEAGDTCINSTDKLSDVLVADFIVSFGYRHIIKEPIVKSYKDRIINIHISLLPWNRGSDPNFWSWFDDTPKGVSIHQMDTGIDTGPLLVQKEIKKWQQDETLKTSWHHLMKQATDLFASEWVDIRRCALPLRNHIGGTYHKRAETEQILKNLPLGLETPVSTIERLGRRFREHQKEDRHIRSR